MFSINMRLFKSTLLLLLAFLSSQIGCLPLEESTSLSSSLSPTVSTSGDHYDQRQNGSDNYRINIDGVLVVVAPIEALLLAAEATSGANLSDTSFIGSTLHTTLKPDEEKPNLEHLQKPIPSPKSTHRSSVRLINLLAPFLRRFYHKE